MCLSGSFMEFFRIVSSSLHRKWSFPLSVFSVNVTKSIASCGFSHIHGKEPVAESFFHKAASCKSWLQKVERINDHKMRKNLIFIVKLKANLEPVFFKVFLHLFPVVILKSTIKLYLIILNTFCLSRSWHTFDKD